MAIRTYSAYFLILIVIEFITYLKMNSKASEEDVKILEWLSQSEDTKKRIFIANAIIPVIMIFIPILTVDIYQSRLGIGNIENTNGIEYYETTSHAVFNFFDFESPFNEVPMVIILSTLFLALLHLKITDFQSLAVAIALNIIHFILMILQLAELMTYEQISLGAENLFTSEYIGLIENYGTYSPGTGYYAMFGIVIVLFLELILFAILKSTSSTTLNETS